MFTGIVQATGIIVENRPSEAGARLVVDRTEWTHDPAPGASIAVNGCCLTAAAHERKDAIAFDVVRQTLDVTTLGTLDSGDRVNLEHAATPTTFLGGHVVQGHVDGVARVVHVRAEGDDHRVRIEPPPALLDVIVERGSVALDGVSLTIARVDGYAFEVALIPTTLRDTTLGAIQPGSRLNLEADYLAKVVVHWLSRHTPGPR